VREKLCVVILLSGILMKNRRKLWTTDDALKHVGIPSKFRKLLTYRTRLDKYFNLEELSFMYTFLGEEKFDVSYIQSLLELSKDMVLKEYDFWISQNHLSKPESYVAGLLELLTTKEKKAQIKAVYYKYESDFHRTYAKRLEKEDS
jgi:hypothetical protein